MLASGNILTLHCFSWHGKLGVSYSLNMNGEVNALDCLVDVVTLPERDPATIKPLVWFPTT